MKTKKTISGFSKLSKVGKLKWMGENFFKDPEAVVSELMNYWLLNEDEQKIIDGFSENTISNFIMPYGVAPNFMINGKEYCVPMVIEESSVVAAASAAAKFWYDRGGFKAKVIDTQKIGQVHFTWRGPYEEMLLSFEEIKARLNADAAPITANMEKRGGGILNTELIDLRAHEADYYQLKVTFETCDSMGANFINSVLESFGSSLKQYFIQREDLPDEYRDLKVIMAILSNYTPDCLARAWVSCPVEDLGIVNGLRAEEFAEKFNTAIHIARIDPYRATTHNKGIFNGIDAVVLATANDFRAIEACGHTYAARDGQYRSLSQCEVKDGIFHFWLDIPLAVGTVGGLTSLHPMAKNSLELLGNPTASELMMIIATTGLAQNFAAVRSLVTTGIQKGHMKMHLLNILNHIGADEKIRDAAMDYFGDKVISFSSVRSFVDQYTGVEVKER